MAREEMTRELVEWLAEGVFEQNYSGGTTTSSCCLSTLDGGTYTGGNPTNQYIDGGTYDAADACCTVDGGDY